MGMVGVVFVVSALIATACSSSTPDLVSEAAPGETTQLGDERARGQTQLEPSGGLSPAIGPQVFTEPEPSNGGRWKRSTVTFEQEATGPERVLSEVDHIERISGAYWAYGTGDNGAGTVWKSANLEHFEKVLDSSDLSCCRLTRFRSIVEFDGKIVLGGTIRKPDPVDFGNDDIEHSMIVYSENGGQTWVEVMDPAFTTPFYRLDGLDVAGNTIIAEVVDDECCGGLEGHTVASNDLQTWRPVSIPSGDHVFGILSNGDTFWALDYPDGALENGRMWSSTDGSTWHEIDELGPDYRRSFPVAQSLGQLPVAAFDEEFTIWDPTGPLVLDGNAWVEGPVDLGQFGDTGGRILSSARHAQSGRTFVTLARGIRSNPHYCFTDISTCKQGDVTVAVTDDGFTWRDVPGPIHDQRARGSLFLDARANPVYWNQNSGSERGPVVINQWVRLARPVRSDPTGFEAPDQSLPIIDWDDDLAIGSEARYIWPFGSCTDDQTISFNREQWVSIAPIDPNEWPHRHKAIFDAPDKFAYGVLRRTAASRLEYRLPELGLVATLEPAPPPDPDIEIRLCG